MAPGTALPAGSVTLPATEPTFGAGFGVGVGRVVNLGISEVVGAGAEVVGFGVGVGAEVVGFGDGFSVVDVGGGVGFEVVG